MTTLVLSLVKVTDFPVDVANEVASLDKKSVRLKKIGVGLLWSTGLATILASYFGYMTGDSWYAFTSIDFPEFTKEFVMGQSGLFDSPINRMWPSVRVILIISVILSVGVAAVTKDFTQAILGGAIPALALIVLPGLTGAIANTAGIQPPLKEAREVNLKVSKLVELSKDGKYGEVREYLPKIYSQSKEDYVMAQIYYLTGDVDGLKKALQALKPDSNGFDYARMYAMDQKAYGQAVSSESHAYQGLIETRKFIFMCCAILAGILVVPLFAVTQWRIVVKKRVQKMYQWMGV